MVLFDFVKHVLHHLQDSLPSSHRPLPEALKETLRLREEPVLRTRGFMGLQSDTAPSTLLEAAEARAQEPMDAVQKRTALKQALADIDSLKDILQQVRCHFYVHHCEIRSPAAASPRSVLSAVPELFFHHQTTYSDRGLHREAAGVTLFKHKLVHDRFACVLRGDRAGLTLAAVNEHD